MAEELRSALSRIAGLTVVARTSSEMLRDADAKTAARKLGVANILTGSVRRSPSTIRVNAQLIDGDNGMERWSENFDRPIGDVLQIQTGIAESVAHALSIRLAGDGRAVLEAGGTRNPAAQDLYLPVRAAVSDRHRSWRERQALSLLDEAIRLDPNFAKAHARKGLILSTLDRLLCAQRGRSASLEPTQALASANRAIAIAPRSALGYAARGAIHRRASSTWARHWQTLKRRISLPGNDADTLRTYASLLGQNRRHDEALKMADRAMSWIRSIRFRSKSGHSHFIAPAAMPKRSTEARRALQISPGRQQARRILANALLWLNRNEEAAAEYRKLEPTDYRRLLGEAVLAIRAGDRGSAMAHLETMRQRYGDGALYQYGEIYAQLGEADRGFRCAPCCTRSARPRSSGHRGRSVPRSGPA